MALFWITVILTTITTYIIYLIRKCRNQDEKTRKEDSGGEYERLLGAEETEEGEQIFDLGEKELIEKRKKAKNWKYTVEDLGEKKTKKFDYIVHELLTTEQRYVDDLGKLVKYFIVPMKKMDCVKKNNAIVTNLSKIEMILKINEKFLEDLESEIDPNGTNCTSKFVDRFSYYIHWFSSTFKLYSDLTSKYDLLDREIVKLKKKKKKFRVFLLDTENSLKNDKKTNHKIVQFTSYLITPIQRIPRYTLLLRDLLKVVDENFREHLKLYEAFAQIQKIAQYCNDKSKELQSLSKVRKLQEKLGLGNVVHPGRKVIEEGSCKRIRDSGKPWDSHICLLSDLLMIYPKKRPRDLTFFKEPYVAELNSGNFHMDKILVEDDSGEAPSKKRISIDYVNATNYSKRFSVGKSSEIKEPEGPSHRAKGLQIEFDTDDELERWYARIRIQVQKQRGSLIL